MNGRPWITFFSQTGSEIASLIAEYNRFPDAVITNSIDDTNFCKELQECIKNGCPLTFIPNKPTIENYFAVLDQYDNPLITLHGFLRIIPKEVCEKYEIYNLHPGLITEYPDLKGKDPQVKALEAGYPTAGCVIHKVIPEVDSGEIVESYAINVDGYSAARMFTELKYVGFVLWKQFFKNYGQRGK